VSFSAWGLRISGGEHVPTSGSEYNFLDNWVGGNNNRIYCQVGARYTSTTMAVMIYTILPLPL